MVDVLSAAFGRDTKFIVYDKHGEAPSRYYPDLIFRRLLYLTRETEVANRIGRNRWLNRIYRRFDEIRFKIGLWAVKNSIPLVPQFVLTNAEQRDLYEYKTADLIVSSGGTYLVENYSLTARIFDYHISLYFGRPLVFFTQSLGPFSNASNRKSLLPIFNNSAAILVRDEHSLRNLTELGVKNGNVHLAADAAFALSDVEAVASAKHQMARVGQRLRVVISVREWRHFKTIDVEQGMNRYCDAIRALSQHLVHKHNAEIIYISTCQGMPEYWTDDSKVAQKIVDGLCDSVRRSVSVDNSFHQPAVLADMLKGYDLVVATRMHMAILALGVGTPVLPIAYEFKVRELFQRLGSERWVQDIETMSGETLINAVKQFLAELPGIRESLFAAVQKEHENALASGQLVRKAFDEWHARRGNSSSSVEIEQ